LTTIARATTLRAVELILSALVMVIMFDRFAVDLQREQGRSVDA
jgi:hypothetical protein